MEGKPNGRKIVEKETILNMRSSLWVLGVGWCWAYARENLSERKLSVSLGWSINGMSYALFTLSPPPIHDLPPPIAFFFFFFFFFIIFFFYIYIYIYTYNLITCRDKHKPKQEKMPILYFLHDLRFYLG